MASENGTTPRGGTAQLGVSSQADQLAKVSSDYESVIQVSASTTHFC